MPEETAIAFVYDGASEAVLMATPRDREDFACGFSITEGIICQSSDLRSLEIVNSPMGVELWMELAAVNRDRAIERRRQRAGPVGVGSAALKA